MVVCKFFLQGNCRFGENCKFEHQLNDGRQHHGSVLRQQNFAPHTNAPTGNTNATIDQNTLIRAVVNDTLAAEKGGQWLLSCYAPFKEKPNFPGFEEQSVEEIRWGFYEATCNGTANQFKQQFQMSLQAAVLKLRSLQNPSPEAVNTIKTIYNSSPGTGTGVFANSTASSNFTNPPANVLSLFNNANANTAFGQSGNIGSTNVFGQNNQQQNSAVKSIFSAANQTLFGGAQQQQSSVFGNNQLANNSNFGGSSPFGQPFSGQNPGFGGVQTNHQPSTFPQQQTGFSAQQPATLPFGSQQQSGISPFHQQPALSSFGTQQQTGNLGYTNQQNPSLFGVQPQPTSPLLGPQQNVTSPLLGSQQNATSPFGTQLPPNTSQQQNQTPFSAQQHQATIPFETQTILQVPSFGNPTNVFGNNLQPPQPHTTSSSHTSSIFGSSGLPSASLTGRSENVVDESIYSKLEELNENDLKSYENDNFEFGKIPEKPPTIQMCF